jgi:hypothetical protein
MFQDIKLFLYPVKDLAQAKTLYRTLLGVEPYADEAYYVGFRVGDQEIGLDPYGHNKGMTGPVGYYQVNDIKKSLQLLLGWPGKVGSAEGASFEEFEHEVLTHPVFLVQAAMKERDDARD